MWLIAKKIMKRISNWNNLNPRLYDEENRIVRVGATGCSVATQKRGANFNAVVPTFLKYPPCSRMCPFRAGTFLNFRWQRLHSTGFCSNFGGTATAAAAAAAATAVVEVPEPEEEAAVAVVAAMEVALGCCGLFCCCLLPTESPPPFVLCKKYKQNYINIYINYITVQKYLSIVKRQLTTVKVTPVHRPAFEARFRKFQFI